MFKAYLAAAIASLGLYGYAQYRGWSIVASEAQEFQRQKAEQAMYRSSGGSGRTGSSGHK